MSEVTATVIETLPVPAPTMPDGWTVHKIAALVRDLAMNLYDTPVILKTHGLSEEQYKLLEENPFFKNAIQAAVTEWNSPHSTNKRLAMEAAIALEDALPALATRMSSPGEPLSQAIEAAKLFAKMAGVGESAQQAPTGEKFKITINLGGDTFEREKERTPRVVMEVQPLIEGEGEGSTVRKVDTA